MTLSAETPRQTLGTAESESVKPSILSEPVRSPAATFTPGPWRVLTPRKISDASMGDWGDRAILAGQGPDTVMLAEVFARTVDKRHGTIEGLRLPTDGNAMLVAAAPDLLNACKLALTRLDDGTEVSANIAKHVRAAITKAGV